MSMTRERIYLFDTTLRDGQQTPGVDFNVEDKIAIAQMLDEFGLDYVEGGYPGANPTDTAFFERKRTVVGEIRRLRHDQAGRGLRLQRSRRRRAERLRSRRCLLCRQKLGPACPRRARLHQ